MNRGIYLITHIASGRKYVGQSSNLSKRIKEHASGNSNGAISVAVQEFGWEAFSVEILELCERFDLDEAESRWIHTHDCLVPNGFNKMRPTGKCHFRNAGTEIEFFLRDPAAIAALDKLAEKHGGVTAAVSAALVHAATSKRCT